MLQLSQLSQTEVVVFMIRKDYSGQKFGKLTVLEFHSYAIKNNKDPRWLCQCECGNTKSVRIRCLKKGTTKTCGLCPKPIGNQHPEWEGCGELSKNLYNTYRHGAKDRGYEFSVSIEYLWDLFLKQDRKCALTGMDIYFPPSYKENKNKTASPDRIDNSRGYIEGNIQWVHREINYLKSDMENDHFIKICKMVAAHNP